MRLYIPSSVLRDIYNKMPRTHELGGHLVLEPGTNTVARVVYFRGEQCRSETGEKHTECKISKPDNKISFHTHPKSNVPSSSDMRNAVLKNPRVSKKGKREISIVMTKKGVWVYRPTERLLRDWKRLSRTDIMAQTSSWSCAKRRIHSKRKFISYMKAEGMLVKYYKLDSSMFSGDGLLVSIGQSSGL